ncbi:hypothetical protein acdb102_23510 [Acidothermaceae bacterium B102]|nr:hypothetical protein acdb102_23510 [Acidothermaceae bacterium B102]
MPFVQVDLHRSVADRLKSQISDEIHAALVEAIDMDPTDKFQIFRLHDEGELVFDHTYNGVDRQDLVYIQILMVHMYDVGSKRRLFDAIARKLEGIGIRHEDVLIAVVENGFEDWYAGKFYTAPAAAAVAS